MQELYAINDFSTMQQLYVWGLAVIKSIQSFQNPLLTFLVKSITGLGNPAAYILALPLVFWCVDEKKGFKLTMICLFSAAFNAILKFTLAVPRPFVFDPTVALISETGFSTPSGHAQVSATLWITVVLLFFTGKTWGRTAVKISVAVGLPLLIGLSRVYLGVHYPTDVFLGWILGSIFAFGGLYLFSLAKKLPSRPRQLKTVLLALAIFAMNAFCPQETIIPAGIFGFGAGYFAVCASGGYKADLGTIQQKTVRSVLGLAGFVLVYSGLKAVFPQAGAPQYELFHFIRYAVIGFWTGFAVPKLSLVLKLAKSA